METSKTPMDLLKEIVPEFAKHPMDEKVKQAVVNDTVSNTLALLSDQKL
jgi:hypothetical protein